MTFGYDDNRSVVAIAEHGSINKAARAMHISQPGLSQRLKRIESQLGTELFVRDAFPLKLTPSGEVYLKYAMRAISAEDAMRREVSSITSRRLARLRIGVSMARANALMSGPIVSFYETHMGCTVELRELNTLEQLHNLFMRDEIDFAVFTPIAPDPALYDVELLCRERLVVIASSQLVIPQLKDAVDTVNLRSLEGVPFVLPSCGAYFDPLISGLVDSTNLRLDIVVRDCSTDLALELVRDGLGVGIVPSTSLKGRTGLRVLELADINAGNVLRYIRRHDRVCTDEERLFIAILRDMLA